MPRMPDDMAARYGSLLDEAEAAIKVLNESKAAALDELRAELKLMGYQAAEIGAEVAMLKGAVKAIRMTEAERRKAEDKDEGIGDYITILGLARARAHEGREEIDADGVVTEPGNPAGATTVPSNAPDTPVVASHSASTSNGADAQPVPSGAPAGEAGPDTDSSASIQPETANEMHERPSNYDEPSPEAGPQAEASPAGTGTGTLAGREGRHEGEAVSADLPASSVAGVAATTGGSIALSPAPAKRLTFNDPAHADCLEPERCGGFSNLGLCPRCKAAAGHVVQVDADVEHVVH